MQPQLNMKKLAAIVAAVACAAGVSVAALCMLHGVGSAECECLRQIDVSVTEKFHCQYRPGGPLAAPRQSYKWDKNEHAAIYSFALNNKLQETAQIDACTSFASLAMQEQYVVCDLGRRMVGDVIPLCGAVMRIQGIDSNSFKEDGTPAEMEEGGRNPGMLRCRIVSQCFPDKAVPSQGRFAVASGGETAWVVRHETRLGGYLVKAIKFTARFGPLGKASRAVLTISTTDWVEDVADDREGSRWRPSTEVRVSGGDTVTVDPAFFRWEREDPPEELNCPKSLRVESVVYPASDCGIVGWIVLSPVVSIDE